MRVGFTGTRVGMTADQQERLRALLERMQPVAEFHHGSADGADSQAHAIALSLGLQVVQHPCIGRQPLPGVARAHAMMPPLERNKAIVGACDVLVAAPETDHEVVRSGTWMTVRYARSRQRDLVVLKPHARSRA